MKNNTLIFIALGVFVVLAIAYFRKNSAAILNSVNDNNLNPDGTLKPLPGSGNKPVEVYRASSGNPASPGNIAIGGRNGQNVDRVKTELRNQAGSLISSSSVGIDALKIRTYSIPAGVTSLQIKMISLFNDGTSASTTLNQTI